ncbi:MAG TPA: class I SAM-dependent methyltransferase [Caulobacteraceae bacterium]
MPDDVHASIGRERRKSCPLCGEDRSSFLRIDFREKIGLPTSANFHHCAVDNFVFLGSGDQSEYNRYYSTLSSDTTHSEVAGGESSRSIASLQLEKILELLGGFFERPRRVLDFGCGEARLLLEMASRFPHCTFVGFEPGLDVQDQKSAYKNVNAFGNIHITRDKNEISQGDFDLVISSHVVEHILDFGELDFLRDCVVDEGFLYVEVPDSLSYEDFERREFLYYFDRLHVNHFTLESLNKLFEKLDFGFLNHVAYAFPYRDGGSYPAIGALFQRGRLSAEVKSPDIMAATGRYIANEKVRAKVIGEDISQYERVMVWGAGDNFCRSLGNEGPLARVRDFILLDRNFRLLKVGDSVLEAQEPESAIRRFPWPVIVMVSEGKQAMAEQIARIDPDRHVLFL